MKDPSNFVISKQAMYETLESRVQGFTERIDENTFGFLIDGEVVHLHAFSQPKEVEDFLEFSFTPIHDLPDNDYERQKKLAQRLITKTTADQNHSNPKRRIIHGYVFLQNNTDYVNATNEDREKLQVNEWGFNQQVPSSKTSGNTFLDKRKIKQAEVAVWAIAQNLVLPSDQQEYYVKHKGIYLPKMDYFNINKDAIESGWFKHIIDPIKNRMQNVYVRDEFDRRFKNWKKSGAYKAVVIPRSIARSHKHIVIQDAFVNKSGKYELSLDEIELGFIKKHSTNRIRPFRIYKTARFKNLPFE